MPKIIVVNKCIECPYFVPAFKQKSGNDYCSWNKLLFGADKQIPMWCTLDDMPEVKK